MTILAEGYSDPLRAKVAAGLSDSVTLRWIPVDDSSFKGVAVPSWNSNATLYRLLIPELLPDHDRVVYLDADLLVRDDLSEIWDADLGGAPAGAVVDAGSPWACGNGTPWRRLGLEPDDAYFNAGVILIDLDAWRREGIHRQAVDVLRAEPLPFADQDALNVTLRRRWAPLPRRWNVQTADFDENGLAWVLDRAGVEAAIDNPGVVHFTERPKPWQVGCLHPLVTRWYETAEATSWRGYQPPKRTIRNMARRLGAFAR